jgi:hypothetical protein
MATAFKQGGAQALPTRTHADPRTQTVTALCRAIRAQLGCNFVGIRSKNVQTATFDFVRAEFDVDTDLPANVEEMHFTSPDAIFADVCAVKPRTLAVLAMGD